MSDQRRGPHGGHDGTARTQAGRRSAAPTRGIALLGLVAVVPVSAATSIQQRAAAPSLVFDKVTVVDVEQGKLLPMQRVVITGNRIQAVGSVGAVKLPEGAQLVDAQGKYLIPGLWDMHVHTMFSSFPLDFPTDNGTTNFLYPLLLANGVTGIRDAGAAMDVGGGGFSLDTLRRWRQEILAGTRVGPPRQILSGPMIQSSELRDNPDTARFVAHMRHLVDSLKSAGADMLKLRDLYPATAYFLIADEARRLGIPFGGHAWHPVDIEASNRGASIIDHIAPSWRGPVGLRAWCWGPSPAASFEKCQSVAELLKRNNTWMVPTLIIDLSPPLTLRTSLLERRSSDRAVEFMEGSLLHGNWLRDSTSSSNTQTESVKELPPDSLVLPDSLGAMRLMQRAGFPMIAGTDIAVSLRENGMLPGFSLHTELAMNVAEGLTPLSALQSATLNPAKMWHATDSLGTVAPGKLADLVLLDADPLADITNTTTVRAVVANGRYFDRAALDSLLVTARAKAQ